MIIKSFTIKNFRSITKTEDLPVSKLSILIGPNNEGKSNILQGLVFFLQFLEEKAIIRRRYYSRGIRSKSRESYVWARDFPIDLQKTKPTGKTCFTIEFELSRREKYDIRRILGSELKDNLLVKLSIGENGRNFSAHDTQDRRKKLDQAKVREFISKRISVQYIGAIRTSERTLEVIDNMISTEMEKLYSDNEYTELIEKINLKEKPLLEELAKNLTETISDFLPDIKKIEIDMKHRTRNVHSYSDLIVDDGTKTSLELKGDGIKSLLAISVIQHVAKQKALKKNMLLAIEEPESHLHPKAIHGFKKVLEEISKENQIIITTHSPLLVNRSKVKSNLLVSKSKAQIANNISEIRNLLGVNISDNLLNSDLVILLEGKDDIIIMKKWLSERSTKIRQLIEDNQIVFDHLSGASNLSYKLSKWKGLLCDVFSFLDNDDAGHNSFNEANKKGLIDEKDVFFCNVNNMTESEMEDFITLDTYKKEIVDKYGVNLQGNVFRNNKKKWSDRVKDTFKSQGKRWSEEKEAEIKLFVAEMVSKKSNTLKEPCSSCIDALISTIEQYFENKNN
ncbi:hypothetical protein BEH94_09085 [Candidatus Altiarchaeales archaeon WOR_SM1_SCG]|nr:hypothetical protein BEH94_09085 [Candidatus Altiarchaeales archaeon WOR_SM1_SCG]